MNKCLKLIAIIAILYWAATFPVFTASVMFEDDCLRNEAMYYSQYQGPDSEFNYEMAMEYRAVAQVEWYCRSWLFPWGPAGYYACHLQNS